jgi:hypothetical protein
MTEKDVEMALAKWRKGDKVDADLASAFLIEAVEICLVIKDSNRNTIYGKGFIERVRRLKRIAIEGLELNEDAFPSINEFLRLEKPCAAQD